MERSAEKSSNLTRADGYRCRKSLASPHPVGANNPCCSSLASLLAHFGRAPALALLPEPMLGGRCCLLARHQGLINPTKGVKPRTMPAEAKIALTPVIDQACGQVHQLLHHRADAPTLHRMAHWSIRADKASEPDVAQEVVNEGCHRKHQVIGRELARGQPLDVEIGLEFGMELLTGGMLFIQPDDLGIGELQRSPPAFDVDLGDQQRLALSIDGALSDSHHATEGVGLLAVAALNIEGEGPHPFAGARLLPDDPVPGCLGVTQPLLGRLLGGVLTLLLMDVKRRHQIHNDLQIIR